MRAMTGIVCFARLDEIQRRGFIDKWDNYGEHVMITVSGVEYGPYWEEELVAWLEGVDAIVDAMGVGGKL